MCSSQVMVNGFRDLFEAAFDSLLCPIDNVLQNVYTGWFNNIEKRIAQYIAVSKQIETWQKRENGNRSELYASLKHNQNALLEALRLFVELGIDVNSLNKSQANLEQRVFIALMKEISNPSGPMYKPFFFQAEYSLSDIVNSFRKTISDEIEREQKEYENADSYNRKKRQERISKLSVLGKIFSKNDLKQVVIHGIHQFTPLQLRFIMLLDALDVEVVFLYNFQAEYKEIYATWETLYQLFDVDIYRDTNFTQYTDESTSHKFAKAFGELIESGNAHAEERKRWYQLSQEIPMIAFNNVSEYGGFVSRYFDDALKVNSNSPISYMTEQVYSASRDIHDLLRIYYPDQSGDRHFLSYPIGQFLIGLYRMWDPTLNQLKFDINSIRECFAADVLKVRNSNRLNVILELTSMYFADIKVYEEFVTRIFEYKKQYKNIQTMINELGGQLRKIAFYQQRMVSFEDIESLEEAVKQLNELAKDLFTHKGDGTLSFIQHFTRLEQFISNRMLVLVEEQEKILVESLLERFKQVSLNTTLSGTMNDLKTGLHYYLKQKELQRPDWIVRNFVQIEGDILLSKRRAKDERKEETVYHFGFLSDRILNRSIDEILPWPLTDYFIRKAYSPEELIFQLYYTSISEYSKFLRYAFFYGLFYNKCKVRLSYVVHVEETDEQPYFPLRMLGIQPDRYIDNEVMDKNDILISRSYSVQDPTNANYVADRNDRIDFFLCPYKYYLDMVCRGDIVIDNSFLLKRYYCNMLIHAVWKVVASKPRMLIPANRIREIIKKTNEHYRKYFPFWRRTNDFFDMEKETENYIEHNLWDRYYFKKLDNNHMSIRFLFGKAIFASDAGRSHPYAAFDVKTRNRSGLKEYPLHAITSTSELSLLEAMKNYMIDNPDNHAVAGEWCNSCSHQRLCMKPYQVELNITAMGED